MGTIADLMAGLDLSAFTSHEDTVDNTHDDEETGTSAGGQETSATPGADGGAKAGAGHSRGEAKQSGTAGNEPGKEAVSSSISEGAAEKRQVDALPRGGAEDATPEEIVLQALLEETGFDPASARLDLTLRGDLDLDDLQLYAVIAVVERALKRTFPDAEIASWATLGDFLDAARQG